MLFHKDLRGNDRLILIFVGMGLCMGKVNEFDEDPDDRGGEGRSDPIGVDARGQIYKVLDGSKKGFRGISNSIAHILEQGFKVSQVFSVEGSPKVGQFGARINNQIEKSARGNCLSAAPMKNPWLHETNLSAMQVQAWTVDNFPDKIPSQSHGEFIPRIPVGSKRKSAAILNPPAFLDEGLPK